MLGSLVPAGQAAFAAQGTGVLHIALHDGFSGQTVTVAIDGRPVYRRSDVRTDLRISRADAFDTAVEQQTVLVAVAVDPGGLHATMRIDTAATPYVAIDLVAGAIRIKPSDEPFRYM